MKKKIILIFLLFISSLIKSQNFPNLAILSTGQGAPNTSEICNDGIDNDNDGFVDGFDSDCPCEDNNYFNICEPECELDFVPQSFSIAQNWESNSSIIPMSSQVVGDINNDGIQDVLALGINGMTISYPRITSDIKIFSGTTGEILTTINTPFTYWEQLSQIAIADIDSDSFAEIFFASSDYGNTANDSRYIFCYNYDGTLKWKSNAQYGDNAPGIAKGGGTLGVADFNYDGISEVYIYNEIFNAQTGVKLIDGGNNGIGHLETGFLNNNNGVFSLSVAADLTSSFGLELAAGKTVYELNLTNLDGLTGNTFNAIQSPINSDGLTAIADINLDGDLDVVVSSAGIGLNSILYVWNPNNSSIIGSISLPSGHNPYDLVSVPFIGDMDSDGKPEIGLTRPLKLLTYKYNQLNNNLEQFWEVQTTDISGFTKLSMFDFNQDGTQELVYRDETQLRIIDGSTSIPQTLASFPSISGTAAEGPIIADINNDNQVEIIIGSENPNTPFVGSLVSYKTNSNPWAPARKVWNQYGYFNVNINDDLSVPKQQQNHGLQFYENLGNCIGATLRPLNSFMAQETVRDTTGCPIYPAPDLTISGIDNIIYDCANEIITFDLYIENIGSVIVSSEFNLLIFEGTFAASGILIQSQLVNTIIPQSGQQSISVNLSNFNLTDFYAILNFDHQIQDYPYQSVNECNYLNNYLNSSLDPPNFTPTFTQVTSICAGETLSALPTISDNDILGNWTPAIDNTATTTYTFTPDTGQCASTETMTITVNPINVPIFTQVPAICSGDPLTTLPTTSDNGILGSWTPALDNTATTTYIFTPDPAACAVSQTMTIQVNLKPQTPFGDANQSFCAIDNPSVSDIILNTNTINWYLEPSGGSLLPIDYLLSDGLVLYASSYDDITFCESDSRFQVLVNVENPTLPSLDNFVRFCEETYPTINSIYTNGFDMIWYTSPFSMDAIADDYLLQDGDVIYGAAVNLYNSCESIDRIAVQVSVVKTDLTYYNLINVDGTSINNALKIEGVEYFPENSIEIYNRYGSLVWQQSNYDNNIRVFKGKANVSGVVAKDSYLPTGTYFFILNYPNDCEQNKLKGFVHIDNKK